MAKLSIQLNSKKSWDSFVKSYEFLFRYDIDWLVWHVVAFHQHVIRSFIPISLRQTLIREKLRKTLLYEKAAHEMLVILAPM